MVKKAPAGRGPGSVCPDGSPPLARGREVYDRAVADAGEGSREVTTDGLFTVEEVECLGACDQAPVVQVNYCSYARVDTDAVGELIEALRRGEVPEPVAGPKPVEHAATARILAGLGDERG